MIKIISCLINYGWLSAAKTFSPCHNLPVQESSLLSVQHTEHHLPVSDLDKASNGSRFFQLEHLRCMIAENFDTQITNNICGGRTQRSCSFGPRHASSWCPKRRFPRKNGQKRSTGDSCRIILLMQVLVRLRLWMWVPWSRNFGTTCECLSDSSSVDVNAPLLVCPHANLTFPSKSWKYSDVLQASLLFCRNTSVIRIRLWYLDWSSGVLDYQQEKSLTCHNYCVNEGYERKSRDQGVGTQLCHPVFLAEGMNLRGLDGSIY